MGFPSAKMYHQDAIEVLVIIMSQMVKDRPQNLRLTKRKVSRMVCEVLVKCLKICKENLVLLHGHLT